MKRFFPLVAIGLLCGLIAMMIYSRNASEPATTGATAEPGSTDGRPASSTSYLTGTSARPRTTGTSTTVLPTPQSKDTIARIADLERMEQIQRERAQAAEKTQQARTQVQAFRRTAWQKVVQDHLEEFEALRVQVAQSPDKQVPCSICSAQGILDLCVVCDHTGICPTCRGVKVEGEICPTCQGTGKCFLCSGTGRMPCPFCQVLPGRKEIITPETPNPSADIPID